jgi:hypothetical protein
VIFEIPEMDSEMAGSLAIKPKRTGNHRSLSEPPGAGNRLKGKSLPAVPNAGRGACSLRPEQAPRLNLFARRQVARLPRLHRGAEPLLDLFQYANSLLQKKNVD